MTVKHMKTKWELATDAKRIWLNLGQENHQFV
jgi:hypothetical protein